MTRSPNRPTDTYLDVLRTLGVTDAALGRHHDADAEVPVRLAIDRDRGSPTADLLDALAATGRMLDLRDGLDAADDAGLGDALARFGFRVDLADPDADGGGEEVVLTVADAVTGATDRVDTAQDGDAAERTLRSALLDPAGIELRALLDGRHLVAEKRELATLAERYGPRIEPFDDPLLTPEAAIDRDEFEHAIADRTEESHIGDSVDPPTEPANPDAITEPGNADAISWTNPTDADGPASEAVDAALADSGPRTHTIEDDGLDDAPAVGGGPKRTVSTSGIDGVFDKLESGTTDDAPAHTAMSDSIDADTDAATDEDESSTDPVETPQGLTGGPTRTVSSTSADDILQRATGSDDFDSIAAEEGEADPDAVLADADGVPEAIEDEVETGSGDDGADERAEDAERPQHAEAESDSETERGGATPPTVDPAAPEPAIPADDEHPTGPQTRRVEDIGAAETSETEEDDEQDAARDGGSEPVAEGSGDGDLPVVSTSRRSASDAAHDDRRDAGGAEGASGGTDRGAPTDDAESPSLGDRGNAEDATASDEPSSAADASPSIDATESPEASGAADASPSIDATESPEASGAADASASSDTTESADVSGASDGNESADAGATSEASRSSDDHTAGAPERGDGIGADLHGDDVELRCGTQTVDRGSDPAPDLSAVEAEDGTGASADGPLAGAGGLRPDDGPLAGAGGLRPDDGPQADASDDAAPSDATAAPASDGDQSAAENAESTESGQGLVSRIASRLFGE
ncbi:hypothetical protein L593_10705 [Salinarchaeum sp. Harcht-Bsk1]|uniref:hypothetical protein n=1 Tax=Salinarchaeum sp. Harcht-Bsk1 TaxID=1333523 RepID=UPI00034234AE|nr:hypothetical protein [Salinarchaeum sp. Harcht-Bsk1]AGN02086.1 hypothetical protein L593_10705 [Salinarchaeum sp. Harcht-Bsk1]